MSKKNPESTEPTAQSTVLANFKRAVGNLERSLSTPIKEHRDVSGVIKDFEMAYELSWKHLKKLLLEAGHHTLGAKDVYTKAYQLGYLKDQTPWLEMIDDRNNAAHVYDEKEAQKIVSRIKNTYARALKELLTGPS